MERFCDYLNLPTVRLTLADVTPDTVQKYIAHLWSCGASQATTARHLASLRKFYKYLCKEGKATANPAAHVQIEQPQKEMPATFSDLDVYALCCGISNIRDRAIIRTLFATGMRVNELIALDVSDFDALTCTLTYGSGDTRRKTEINDDAAVTLADYIVDVRPKLLDGLRNDALFLSAQGNRLARQSVWKILKNYGCKLGVEGKLSPSVLRHSFAVNALKSGANVYDLKQQMGHVDISSTKMYKKLL